jgi:hypothetical protein
MLDELLQVDLVIVVKPSVRVASFPVLILKAPVAFCGA